MVGPAATLAVMNRDISNRVDRDSIPLLLYRLGRKQLSHPYDLAGRLTDLFSKPFGVAVSITKVNKPDFLYS